MMLKLTVTICLLLFSSIVYSEENNLPSNRIVAVVNEELITQNELEQKKVFLIYQLKQTGKENISQEENRELEKALIERLIVNKLVTAEAKKENITIDEKSIKEKIENIKRRFPNENAFTTSLREAGLTMEDLYASFEYELILEKLFFDKWRRKIIISPQEIDGYYQKHREEFKEPERVRLKNIFISKKGRFKEEISHKMEEISNLLKENIPFEEVAQKYSEGVTANKGGVMEEIRRGELSPDIEKVIFSLKPGELSPWIETESGFYLFKLDEYIPGKILNFSEAQEEIRNFLYKKKLDERFNKWIAELKEKAFIRINE
ncbi:MAG: peptidyl-prolyl cis-trans isomerase [Candidatus Omnitrophica bacterium]|nr:peptidyl-prolyl cis-trans isomerase [Candidatus Omnitrophota bacterium]MCM8793452.1 peptidyl-prolyl cis-trans isomerase [Candidatus Omnitrophota bacterium]